MTIQETQNKIQDLQLYIEICEAVKKLNDVFFIGRTTIDKCIYKYNYEEDTIIKGDELPSSKIKAEYDNCPHSQDEESKNECAETVKLLKLIEDNSELYRAFRK